MTRPPSPPTLPAHMLHGSPAARDRAITACLFVVGVFIPYDLYQYGRFFLAGKSPFLNMDYAWHSMLSNLLVTTATLAWLAPNLLLRRRYRTASTPFYYPSFVALVTLYYAVMFYQIHLVGMFNTIIVLYNLGLFLIISWILRWRDALFFFWASNAALLAMAVCDFLGLKAYAPLSPQHEILSSIYLDADVLAMNLVIYGVMAAIIVGTVTYFKRSMERINADLLASNQALADEIRSHRSTQSRNLKLIADLENALSEVKTLTGLLPICSHCKNIRDDKGYWKKLESYLHEHSGARFTHSVCPQCMNDHYGEFLDGARKRPPEEPGRGEGEAT